MATTTGTLYDAAYIRHVPSPFNPSQIKTYLKKIGWHSDLSADNALSTIEPNLDNLRTLMLRHILTFPMDDTDLHYTAEHHMPVSPRELYDRMVLGGKGSYCFGQNGLFLAILRGLGYRAYAAAGRVLVPPRNPSTGSPGKLVYTAFSHLVLLVQPYQGSHANITYQVDVGFGGVGPLRPILLADGNSDRPQKLVDSSGQGKWAGGWIWGSYPPERHRIVRGAFTESSLEQQPNSGRPAPRDWHFQVSHTTPYAWKTVYSFTEVEFFQWDIDAGSYSVSGLPGTIFHHKIICMHRFEVPLDPSEEDVEETEGLAWIGKWTMEGGKATKRIGSKVLEEKTFNSERERLEVIRDVFGINVSVEDEQWIIGGEAALKT